MESSRRELDVVVFGATGYTGRLAAEYLAKRYGAARDLRWALAGRSAEKLGEVRDALARVDPAAAGLPLVIADSNDRATLDALARRTRVVLTTVGPYALHGRLLVAACASAGTHYCDLTGEVPFIRDMIDAHHAEAAASGARIVCCTGFDSIPSDLGVLTLQAHAAATWGEPCERVALYVTKMKGGVSGGTVASMMNLVDEASRSARVRAIALDPYALTPGDRGDDGRDQATARFDRALGQWTAPFVMAAINTRVVRRSHALLGHPWGRGFRYSECVATGAGPAGAIKAGATAAGLGATMALMATPPTRALLKTVLPAQGEGPSPSARERGSFEVTLLGTRGDRELRWTVAGKGDPGYAATARMIAESAVCLAKDELTSPGGVLTPASAMGARLVDRLRDADFRFEAAAPASR